MRRNASRQIVTPNLDKNSFDISNYWIGTTRIGQLTPVRWDDVTPNSHWKITTNYQVKFAPILYPLNHKVEGVAYTCFVPNRLMMPKVDSTNADWENFIMGDPNEKFTNDILPYTTINDTNKAYYDRDTLANKLGLPYIQTGYTVNAAAEVDINVLPFLAYHMIWDEFLRNPWTQERSCGPDSTWFIDLSDRVFSGADLVVLMANRNCNYDADYFMGAWPEAYAGSATDVELDLAAYGAGAPDIGVRKAGGAVPTAGAVNVTAAGRLQDTGPTDLVFGINVEQGITSTLEMMELRRAESLTRFLEAENRAGTEMYDDWLKIMFGNDVDFKYARPIFLGGDRQTINVIEVLSTAETYDYSGNDLTTQQTLNPQGSQVGHAMASSGGKQINFTAQEHGILMTVFVVKPSLAYGGSQIERFWLKK